MFVLVQWTSGGDKGRYSVLEASCVRGFDHLKFDSEGNLMTEIDGSISSEVVVEWRAGKKPKSGWPVYHASLLRASG